MRPRYHTAENGATYGKSAVYGTSFNEAAALHCGKLLSAASWGAGVKRPRGPKAARPLTVRRRHPVPPEFMPRRSEARFRGSTGRRRITPERPGDVNLGRFNEAAA